MTSRKLLILLAFMGLLSFKAADKKVFEFNYPKRKGTDISLSAEHLKKFTKEWRGTDYYYYSEDDGFICSVLYYKLDDNEKQELIDAPKTAIGGPDISPAYPYAYFKNYSKLKSMEKNDSSWGKSTDDFMFRQNDVIIEGTNFSQKNMYAYAMAGKDLFVNIHLSKVGCTSSDSTEMMGILKSLVLKK
ncbi:MAG TPA: hypothetical protein VK668_00660 [Mucilaginibacter sp.]|nr:hypothetical protein [Mucilaginibacter sp.]